MKSKMVLMITYVIGVLALISTAYCFWLMTVPLSYDRVYVVVIGFAVSLSVFVIVSITSFICVIRLRRSRCVPRSPQITPTEKA